MKVSFSCFGCKKTYETELKKSDVSTTKNNRYVASVHCSVCKRKMTSLVSRAAYEAIQGEAEDSKPGEEHSSE